MKRILVVAGTACGFAGLALAYSPTTGAWDKPYLALLVPGLVLNLWAMFTKD